MQRHEISDESWARIKDLLPGRPGQLGWVACDNRTFINAVLWILRTGSPWRDPPEYYGRWNTAWKRFDRWSLKGTWPAVFAALAGEDPDLEWLIIDSTVVRAHQHAAGKKGGKLRRRWAAPPAA